MGRKGPSSRVLWCGLGLLLLLTLQGAQCEHEPTESECRPYIVKALKEHHVDESVENDASSIEQEENPPIDEKTESLETSDEIRTGEDGAATTEDSTEGREETDASAAVGESAESQSGEEENKTEEDAQVENASTENSNQETEETGEEKAASQENDDSQAGSQEEASSEASGEVEASVEGDTAEVEGEASQEATTESLEVAAELETAGGESTDSQEAVADEQSSETTEQGPSGEDSGNDEGAQSSEDGQDTTENTASVETASGEDTKEDTPSQEETTSQEASAEATQETSEEVAAEAASEEETQTTASEETAETAPSEESADTPASQETPEAAVSVETAEVTASEESSDAPASGETADAASEETAEAPASTETAEATASEETAEAAGSAETAEAAASEETAEAAVSAEATEPAASVETAEVTDSTEASESKTAEEGSSEEAQQEPVEDLTREVIIPANLRPRDHITQILKLDEGSVENESAVSKTIDSTLNTLKKLYDNAIKPLEILYKYRDLSNRHFGDPEIFSKPLVLFMGPWSGGKSSTINYLLDLEFTELALRTGAEPSPAYFNILTYGEETEILDGTQLAADWTFSGLQKFGQGLLDRLRGVKLKSRLLEKVNIVEIPGILEIRKQVQRLFPFNDACQWFIDRADIIFLMYDPAKLDVGPETEAILDQLKGREYQTRIVLNKADQVKPEELMRVQGTLIWNISPLMSSQEPPVMYTTSLWSLPYETNAPTRLLIAQERALLRDLREAIDKRVENKIASARRFAVRVRNHAKMVDCYLTTYYNHKTFFGNKKKIADDITENPQKYHIYEGLSTLTNISRYDLPDPDMYRDFFRINNLYDFTKLSDTCTYFRGCPINKLDISIAYDLPDLVGKYKKAVEQAKTKS